MTTLTALKRTDEEFADIYTEFTKGISMCKIHSITKIDMPKNIVKKHETYKKSKKSQIQRLFHGTRHCCDIINILSNVENMCKNEGCG